MSKEDMNRKIDEFIGKCRPKMREVVELANRGSPLLPSWKPELSAENRAFTEHIWKLEIPTLSDGRPSLLLHGLGDEKGAHVAPTPGIFSKSHTCVT